MTDKTGPLPSVEELAGNYALNVQWKGDDYGKRKQYYADAFTAGYQAGAQRLLEAEAKLNQAVFEGDLARSERDKAEGQRDIFKKMHDELLPQSAKEILELEARVKVLEDALKGVISVADRKTKEFDLAHQALGAAGKVEHTGKPRLVYAGGIAVGSSWNCAPDCPACRAGK